MQMLACHSRVENQRSSKISAHRGKDPNLLTCALKNDHAQVTGHTQWHDPNHDESVKDVATSCEDPHTEPHVSPSSPARHWGKSLKTSERSSRSKNYARPNPDVAPPAEGDRGSHGEGKAYKIRASPPPDTAPPAEGDRGSCGEGAVPKLN